MSDPSATDVTPDAVRKPLTFSFQLLSVSSLKPDSAQPRKKHNLVTNKELAESMRVNGMLQTILVREENGKYIIINGERRWTAATSLGWENVNCLVTTADSKHALQLQLIENVQREDLSQEDLSAHLNALASQHAAEDNKATMRVLGGLIGKSVGWVSEKLALARLSSEVQALLDNKTVKNSRVLIGLSKLSESNPEAATSLIKEIEEGKTVTVDLINEVRGKTRQKRAHKEVAQLSDLPAGVLPPPEPTATSEPSAPAPSPAETGAPVEPTIKPKRKKKVSDVAKLIGVPDDMPTEELLEAFAEAYAKLFAERQ